jgi:hypothetical protein
MDQAHQQERLDSPEASAEINALSIRLGSAAPRSLYICSGSFLIRQDTHTHTQSTQVSERKVSINPGSESTQHATMVYIFGSRLPAGRPAGLHLCDVTTTLNLGARDANRMKTSLQRTSLGTCSELMTRRRQLSRHASDERARFTRRKRE